MNDPIKVLIADDHAIVREGLRSVIGTQPDLLLVGEAANGEEVIQKTARLHPDVILMDLVMPQKSGLQAISELCTQYPGIRILVLTSFDEDGQVFAAIRAGALGYMLKDSSPRELLDAIRCVYRGESSLHPAVARKLILKIDDASRDENEISALTERETEVVCLIARGLPNLEIAEKLSVSEGTIRFHVGNILGKLQLENRTQIALYALRKGLATL
ncbi:MAG: response regulator transcription factor [Anaerolineae bacterium]|nr:response regulator transcription factor [Anaerolineae bacterium]